MPGPILRLAGAGDSMFESCDDIQEAWGGDLNGDMSVESVYHECSRQEAQRQDARRNGDPATPSPLKTKIPEHSWPGTAMAEATPPNTPAAGRVMVVEVQDKKCFEVEGGVEDMELEDEVEDEDDAVEAVNLPVVSASLSVDLTTSLMRHKISSVQRGPTLSFADTDDAEEFPTRRTRPLVHANDSIEVAPPLHLIRPAPTSHTLPTSPASPHCSQRPPSPSLEQHSIRVSRNPSYHFAVRDAAFATPKNSANTHSSGKGSRSCDTSPTRAPMEPLREEGEVAEGAPRLHASESDGLITIPLATNMSRSVSFSGQQLLSPATAASGSLSEGNSRSGSVPQLSSAPNHRSAPILETKAPPPTFTRGSVISRSFRRLFNTPSRTPPPVQPEEEWDDVPGVHHTSEVEAKSSRLRRISSSFSRKLANKPKMSGSPGLNGQHSILPNGSTSPEDATSLVEYDNLLKLFCCSGCHSFMTPPLHQCRKGHLVCNSCRFSLKQACPTCKQRFSESTNMMMEQVCQLVKFPCKYAAQGCTEFHMPRAKQDHEHFCSFRPVHCHHGPQGCPKVLLLRDMHQHLEQCDFKKK